MKSIGIWLLACPVVAIAAATSYRLDSSPHDLRDLVSLQAGARTYVNYCLGCHGVQFMRYKGLTEFGLSEAQIKEHLLFTADKVGESMKVALDPKEAKGWFGVAPPDLSVVARSRGADWLYTYLRTFYRDPKTVTGWNNAVYPNVAMPHALWTLQGEQGWDAKEHKLTEISKGSLSPTGYDTTVRDLVNFLVYVSEPAATDRKAIGIVVLFVLAVVFIFAYLLKKEFWKDVKLSGRFSLSAGTKIMMQLYSGTTCPFSHRCRFVLYEKGMDFQVIDVDLYNKPEDIAVMNPYNRLPVLVERDLILYESNIINEYIDERFPHPQLMPADPVMRARARLMLFNMEVELFSQIEALESGKEKQVERARQHVTDRLIELAPVFTKTKHMLGDDFTMLDVAVAPLLWRLDHYGIKLGKTAAPLMKYAERIFSRPAFIEALTPSEKVMRK
jgi:stringent starvation protein A